MRRFDPRSLDPLFREMFESYGVAVSLRTHPMFDGYYLRVVNRLPIPVWMTETFSYEEVSTMLTGVSPGVNLFEAAERMIQKLQETTGVSPVGLPYLSTAPQSPRTTMSGETPT